MAGRTIVLAHGVLGFGNPTGLPTFINYFNGGAVHLRRRGHNVIAPQVNPVGSVAQRGDQLAAAILAIFKQAPAGEKVHIIAAWAAWMRVMAHVPGVAERVATLVTIGTPHRGSPVADAIANRTDPLFEHIPPFVSTSLSATSGR